MAPGLSLYLSTVSIRRAVMDDSGSIARIYNQGIQDRTATFETRLRDASEIARWFDGRHPIVVADAAGAVVGFASTSTYRDRDCYVGIAEFSVYVERSGRGKGAGTLLMRELISESRRAGFWKLVSRVFVDNAPSRAPGRGVARRGYRRAADSGQSGLGSNCRGETQAALG
jgi:phosphinothricin acetyltransferase